MYAQPHGAAFAAVPQHFSAVLLRALLFVAVFGLSFTMACARIAEAPANPLAWLRVAATLAAIALVTIGRRGNFVHRALLAFALESASGIAMLVYVDLPFYNVHAEQVASGVVASYYNLTKRDIVGDLHALHRHPQADTAPRAISR